MQRTVIRTNTYLIHNHNSLNPISSRTATTSIVKLQKQAKPLAADGSGVHSHVVKTICEETNCESKKCLNLCTILKRLDVKGHFTHKPVAGKFCRFLGDKDAKNHDQTQYYVKNADQDKKANATQTQNHYQQGHMKTDTAMENYIKTNKLEDKIDD